MGYDIRELLLKDLLALGRNYSADINWDQLLTRDCYKGHTAHTLSHCYNNMKINTRNRDYPELSIGEITAEQVAEWWKSPRKRGNIRKSDLEYQEMIVRVYQRVTGSREE